MYDILIRGGEVIDGSGKKAFRADVAIQEGKVVHLGNLPSAEAHTIINAEGRYVTPGFFDMHSHADLTAVLCPEMEGLLGQGITSVFAGHCGMTMAPVGEYFFGMMEDVKAIEDVMPLMTFGRGPGNYPVVDAASLRLAFAQRFGVEMDWTTFADYRTRLGRLGLGVNMYMEVGHAQIRMSAMGPDFKRHATPEEIEHMKQLVQEAMACGATGLSFGLDYAPGIYASDEELSQLAECLIPLNGILAAHIRGRGKRFLTEVENYGINGIRELMDLGVKHDLRVHISHLGTGFRIEPFDQRMLDASARVVLDTIAAYRNQGAKVSWDTLVPGYIPWFFYPDLAGLLRYYVTICGGKKAFAAKLQSPAYQRELAEAIKNERNPSFGRIRGEYEILRCKNNSYVGKTVGDIATELGLEPIYAVFHILL
ncbi:MAG: amidohydrolase family protein, partial [Symbiobacteriaceae bacterium]|nr:amidohydrolase family protein [Symbiobacteriaceae bacterium]